MKDHPIHVVTAWLGNTPRIALKHYLQVTDADFERASKSGAPVAQNAAQHAHAGDRNNSYEEGATPYESYSSATPCETQLVAAKCFSGEDRIRTCGGE